MKFRAWHKADERMLNVVGMNFESCEITYRTDRPSLGFASFKDIQLMQWTGLTDYKGNDIYLNDIVEFDIDNACYTMIAQVIWHEDRCCFGVDVDDPYYIGDLLTPFKYGNGVVLGNIYENPELLERK